VKKHSILLLLLFASIRLFAQEQSDFKSFLKLFPVIKLPFYVTYCDSDFTSEDDFAGGDTCESWNGVINIDSAGPLSFVIVKKILSNDSERNEYEKFHYDDLNCYAIGEDTTPKDFFIIIYGVIQEGFEQQYMCTLNKQGGYLSKICIGWAGLRGTGLCGNDTDWMRIPWCTVTRQACIEDDLTIKMGDIQDVGDSTLETNTKIQKEPVCYFINNNGYIRRYVGNSKIKSPFWGNE
jgi:hypothetical protein